MPPVFGHGRLRLYLLKLLGEAPRHGYEVIRLLEERFQGRYAPSAGTVYPRLAKLEAEGLVTHAEEGGRKVYSLTEQGLRELRARGEELTALEREIRESLTALAAGIREDVSGTAQQLREQVRQAAARAQGGAPPEEEAATKASRPHGRGHPPGHPPEAHWHGVPGAWPPGGAGHRPEAGGWGPFAPHTRWGEGAARAEREAAEAAEAEREEGPVADPFRELERLLDRHRDDIRDAARDHGVSQEQLREARRLLTTASAHVCAMLRSPEEYRRSQSE